MPHLLISSSRIFLRISQPISKSLDFFHYLMKLNLNRENSKVQCCLDLNPKMILIKSFFILNGRIFTPNTNLCPNNVEAFHTDAHASSRPSINVRKNLRKQPKPWMWFGSFRMYGRWKHHGKNLHLMLMEIFQQSNAKFTPRYTQAETIGPKMKFSW